MPDQRGDNASTPTVTTWDVLVAVGFREDPSDGLPSFCFDFGNFKLSALQCTNRWFVDIVLLTGVLMGRGTLSEVHGEIRAQEESREAVLAHVAWVLDQAAGGWFQPKIPTAWLDEGRAH